MFWIVLRDVDQTSVPVSRSVHGHLYELQYDTQNLNSLFSTPLLSNENRWFSSTELLFFASAFLAVIQRCLEQTLCFVSAVPIIGLVANLLLFRIATRSDNQIHLLWWSFLCRQVFRWKAGEGQGLHQQVRGGKYFRVIKAQERESGSLRFIASIQFIHAG